MKQRVLQKKKHLEHARTDSTPSVVEGSARSRTKLEKQRSMPCAVDKQKDESLILNLSVRI